MLTITVASGNTYKTIVLGVQRISIKDVLQKFKITLGRGDQIWLKRNGHNVYRKRPLSPYSQLEETFHNNATIFIAPAWPAPSQTTTQITQLIPSAGTQTPILPQPSATKKWRRVARATLKRQEIIKQIMRKKIRARKERTKSEPQEPPA